MIQKLDKPNSIYITIVIKFLITLRHVTLSFNLKLNVLIINNKL